jgi:DNA-binding NarL/FixJ family response regulator
MRVFIVEDSQILLDRILQYFARENQIEVIGSSAEAANAIAEITRLKPDLVLLDIRLRQGNGFQVLQAVKKSVRSPIVIILTNFSYIQYSEKFLAQGADYFFDKSTEFNQAIDVVRELARHGRYQRPLIEPDGHSK